METRKLSRLISFLHEELAIPKTDLQLALKHPELNIVGASDQIRWSQTLSLLPMILWQYGLVSLNQLDEIFDWLATCI
jgi:Protein of unknown function (DUF2949)